jgi:hypothetical protein
VAFSLEELGKAEMLLKQGIEAATTGPRTIENVMAGDKRQPTKKRAGYGQYTNSLTRMSTLAPPPIQELTRLLISFTKRSPFGKST